MPDKAFCICAPPTSARIGQRVRASASREALEHCLSLHALLLLRRCALARACILCLKRCMLERIKARSPLPGVGRCSPVLSHRWRDERRRRATSAFANDALSSKGLFKTFRKQIFLHYLNEKKVLKLFSNFGSNACGRSKDVHF